VTPNPVRDAARRVADFYEQLSATDVGRIPEFYAADALFRDPFNEVRGSAAIAAIFARMFGNLDEVRFRIRELVADDAQAVLIWDFTFRLRRYRPDVVQSIEGSSHLRFDAAGRVTYHRDYWDAADALYAKLPLVGPVIRLLKRRLG
jgi:steroid delta-isomerase